MALFPTAVIGSLPRPKWVLDLLFRYETGALSEQELDKALDRAVGFAIGLQETAGIDTISDGEWRRIGYFEIFAQRINGFEADEYSTQALPPEFIPDAGLSSPQQWTLKPFKQRLVVHPVNYTRPIVADAARFLRANTDHPIKVTLPSPNIIGHRLWHPEYSRKAYPKRRDFINAVIPILRKEVEALKSTGVDVVQFDDPWFCFFVDPIYRSRFDNPESEMAQAVEDLNQVVEGISGIKTVLHVCRGNRARSVYARGDYGPILPFLLKTKVDQLALEFAVSEAGNIDIFEGITWEGEIGLGVVDVRVREVEPPEVIVERVEHALRFFTPEQLTLTPDCGFAPTSTNPIPIDEAYEKLCALSQAAQIMRNRYG